MPETKDRTLEEIDEMFEEKLGARKFKNHKCTRIITSRMDAVQTAEHKHEGVPRHVEEI